MIIPFVRPVEIPRPHIQDPEDVRFLSVFVPWREGEVYDAVMVGIPSDVGTLGRKGAARGPAEIRRALRFVSSYSPTGGDLAGKRVADVGDVDIGRADLATVDRRVEAALQAILARASRVIVLGGDHSITAPIAQAWLAVTGRPIGLIYIDAHLDLRVDPPSSGNGVRRALDAGAVARVVNIGARPYANSARYWAIAQDRGVYIIAMDRVRDLGARKAAQHALAYMSDVDALYVSFDVDALDIAYAPGVSSPGPGGLTAQEAYDMMEEFGADPRLRLVDIAEVAPPLDPVGITVVTTAYLLAHLLGVWLR